MIGRWGRLAREADARVKRRPLLLQNLEERILWDATMAPVEPQPELAAEQTGAPDPGALAPTPGSIAEPPAPDMSPSESDGESDLPRSETESRAVDGSDEVDAGDAGPDSSDTVSPTGQSGGGGQSADESSDTGTALGAAGAPQGPEATDEDSGPGLPESEFDRSEEPFNDAAQTGGGGQSGLLASDQADTEASLELVFVDSRVTNHQTLIDDIESRNEDGSERSLTVYTLDGERSGVEQGAEILAAQGAGSVGAVHVLSYGGDASLRLGADVIDADNIDSFSDDFARWAEALGEDADILLYGCDIAGSDDGRALVEDIAAATGADVAASDDATGSGEEANWELEYASGAIETAALLNGAGDGLEWRGVLDDPIPQVTVSAPEEAMLGAPFGFSLEFENAANPGADAGFTPYIDFVSPDGMDITGISDVTGDPVDAFADLTWNGSDWEDGSGTVVTDHPLTGLALDPGDTGERLQILRLPFGSYTPEQPATVLNFTAEWTAVATLGTAEIVSATPGFALGTDAIVNPATDPPIVAGPVTAEITPAVIQISKRHDAPDGETATGPNFPVTYTLTVDVASGVAINDVVVTDFLSDNAIYRGDVVITPINGSPGFSGSTSAPAAFSTPGGTLKVDFGSVTGQGGNLEGEYEIEYSVYFDETAVPPDQAGGDGLPRQALNESTITGLYDGRTVTDTGDNDAAGPDGSVDDGDVQHEVNSLTVRKSVTNLDGGAPDPGDTLQYTIHGEVSDYFAFEDVVVNDIMGDGQSYVGGSATLLVFEADGGNGSGDSSTVAISIDAAYVGASRAPSGTGDGTTGFEFRISDFLDFKGLDPQLAGDLFDGDTGTDPTTLPDRTANGTRFQIVYRATVDNAYQAAGRTDDSVDLGDLLTNDTAVSGKLLDENLSPTGESVTDDGAASIGLANWTVEKSLYAVNGDTGNIDAITTGDTVTYRVRAELPSANTESLAITDFLPLPVFDAGLFTSVVIANDTDGDGVPDNTNTTPTFDPYTVEYFTTEMGGDYNLDEVPLLAGLGAGTVSVSVPGGNSLRIDFGDLDQNDADSSFGGTVVIDLLISAEVLNQPMADGLFLTNQAQGSSQNSDGDGFATDSIVQIELLAPDVRITKGVITTDGPNGIFYAPDLTILPEQVTLSGTDIVIDSNDPLTAALLAEGGFDADLGGVDGGDLVTFAIAVSNVGASAAYGVQLRDTLPDGFIVPGGDAQLQVYDGTGALLVAGTDYTLGSEGLFDIDGVVGNDGITFVTELDGDRANTAGSIGNRPIDDVAGDDVFIVTYTLEVDNETVIDADIVQAGSSHTNTATVPFYTGDADDVLHENKNWVGDPLADDATVTIATPSVDKTLVGTGIVDGDGTSSDPDDGINGHYEATIGETVEYAITVTLPEGETANAVLHDSLDRGLELVSIDAIEVSNPGALTSSIWGADFGGFTAQSDASGTNLDYTFRNNAHSEFALNLGDLVNSDDDNATAETITIRYTAMVVNEGQNDHGDTRSNAAHLSWDSTDAAGAAESQQSAPESAADVTIIEPDLRVVKTVSVDGAADADSAPGDAGDAVTYTIVIDHRAVSGATAHDAVLTDVVPAGVVVDPNSLTAIDGDNVDVSSWFTLTGQTIGTVAGGFDLAQDESITLTVSGTIAGSVAVGNPILNEAEITWTSLDGEQQGLSNFVPDSIDGERGPAAQAQGEGNDYDASDAAEIITANDVDKFLVNTGLTNEGDASGDGQLSSGTAGINQGAEAVIGEYVTYQTTVTFAEGVTDSAVLVDTMDAGLEFVDITAVQASSFLSSDTPGGLTLAALQGNASFSGGVLRVDFGAVTNSDMDNDTTEELVITYRAVVTNESLNQSGEERGNSVVLESGDGQGGTNQTDSDSADPVAIIEPELEVTKTVSLDGGASSNDAPGDAGDAVTYTIEIAHSAASDTDAFDAVLADTVPGDIENLSLDSAVDGNNVDVSSFFTLAGQSLGTIAGGFDLAWGETITLTLSGTLAQDVSANQVIENEALLTWSSLDDAAVSSDPSIGLTDRERDGSDGEGDVLNNYADSDPATINVPGLEVNKAYIGSDIAGTADAIDPGDPYANTGDLTIGEIATYQMLVTLPEGTQGTLDVVDLLPLGMSYVAGSARLITQASDSSLLAADFSGTIADRNGTLLGNGSAITTLGTGADIDGNGALDTVVQFGQIVTTGAPGSSANQFVIEVQSLVENLDSNRDGTSLTNSATVNDPGDVGTDPAGSDNAPTVNVVLPEAHIEKTFIDPATGAVLDRLVDAGDELTIRLEVANHGTAPIYDAVVEDDIDENFIVDPQLISGVGLPAGWSFAYTGNGIVTFIQSGAANRIDPGETVTLDFNVTVAQAVGANSLHTNTAEVTRATTTPGDNDNESDRADPDDQHAQGPEDLEDNAQFETPGFTLEKVFVTSSNPDTPDAALAIGETATYQILVTVPEGTHHGLEVTDYLPEGLGFGSARIITNASDSALLTENFVGTITGTGSATGYGNQDEIGTSDWMLADVGSPGAIGTLDGFDDVRFTLDVVATGSNDPLQAGNAFVLEIDSVVRNIEANADGTGLTNNAAVNDPNDGEDPVESPEQPTVEVVLPEVTIDKTFWNADNTAEVEQVDAGDRVTVRLEVSNTGSAPAYDVVVEDVLDPAFYDVSSVLEVNADGFTFTDDGNGNIAFIGGTIDTADDDIAGDPDDVATLYFSVVVSQSVAPYGTDVNTAMITQATTTPGDNEKESDLADPNDPHAQQPDTLEDDDNLFIPGIAIEKAFVASSLDATDGAMLTIGEIATYQILVTLPEGTTPALEVVDALPDGMGFVAGSSSVITTSADSSLLTSDFDGTVAAPTESFTAGSPGYGVNGGDVILKFDSITVTGGTGTSNNQFVIELQAVVLDVPANQGNGDAEGTLLTNQASADSDSTDPDNPTEESEQVTVEVVEPELEIGKRFVDAGGNDVTNVTVGQTVYVDLTVNNTGDAPAYDMTVADALDADFFDTGSIAAVITPPSGWSFAIIGGDTPTWTSDGGAALAAGASLAFRFSVEVTGDAQAIDGTLLDNTATVTGDSIPGDDPNQRDSEDDGSDVLFGPPTLVKTVFDTSLGDTGSAQGDPDLDDVAVGEIVTYQLALTLPPNVNDPVFGSDLDQDGTPGVVTTLVDASPAGMTLLGGSVISIGGVTIPGASAGGEITANGDNHLAVGDTESSGFITISGQEIRFDFGNLEVDDDDGTVGDEQRIVVEITARLDKDLSNTNLEQLTNTGELILGDPTDPLAEDSDTADIEVVLPEAGIDKTFIDPRTGEPLDRAVDAGDTLTVRLVVSNSGTAPIYDALIEDDIDESFIVDPRDAVLPAGWSFNYTGNDIVTFTQSGAGNRIDPGEQVTLEFTVTVAQTVAPYDTYENTAKIAQATTMPGDNDAESDRADPNDPLKQNPDDLEDSDTLFVPGIDIEKAFVFSNNPDTPDVGADGLPDLNVGEVAAFQFLVTLPEGVTPALQVIDELPAGMGYLANSLEIITSQTAGPEWPFTAGFDGVITIGGVTIDTTAGTVGSQSVADSEGVTFAPGPDNALLGDDGGDVTIDFGEIIVSGDTGTAQHQFVIQLQAVVLDVPSNQSGSVLTNTATAEVDPDDDNPPTESDPVDVSVVDPDLAIDKRFTDINGRDIDTARAGDTVYVELIVANQGSGPAYDLEISDPLDASSFNVDSVVLVSVPGGAGGWVYTGVANGTVSFAGDGALMPGDSVKFVFSVQLQGKLGPDTVINTAGITAADTVPGSDPNGQERDVSGPIDDDELRIPAPPDVGIGGDPSPLARFEFLPLQETESFDEFIERIRDDIQTQLDTLPTSALYSGAVTPTSNVTLILKDNEGLWLAQRSVVADVGGNWLINFQGEQGGAQVSQVEVRVQAGAVPGSAIGEFNTRVYFTEALEVPAFFSHRDDVGRVFDTAPGKQVAAHAQELESPLRIGGLQSAMGEFLVTATPERL